VRMVQRDKRLEVICLAAKGLKADKGRRKVQMTLVSKGDPNGEAWGAKVSPWLEVDPQSDQLQFGQSGLMCSFPLSGSPGAPAVASDPRFPESAKLRIRVLASTVSSQNIAMRTATAWLPGSFVQGLNTELDEATAQVEAEVELPLTNLLSGRTGFAADRALGGWVPLTRCNGNEAQPPVDVVDDCPIQVWMQAFAMPDHEHLLPMLAKQREEAQLSAPRKRIVASPHAAAQRTSQNQHGQATQRLTSASEPTKALATKWGPNGYGKPDDLIDVGISKDLIDITSQDSAEATLSPPQQTGNGNILECSMLDFGPPIEVQSGDGSSASGLAPVEVQSVDGSSAFGFIAANSSTKTLDLAALYDSNGFSAANQAVSPPAPCAPAKSQAKFAALSGFPPDAKKETISLVAPVAPGKNLSTLEESVLAGLSQSLKS